MSLAFKHGVRIFGIRPELTAAIQVVDGVLSDSELAATITSVCDGQHSPTSLHYTGCAFDVRIRDIPKEKHEIIRTLIADRLTIEFDTVLENDHIHVEFQPKKGIAA